LCDHNVRSTSRKRSCRVIALQVVGRDRAANVSLPRPFCFSLCGYGGEDHIVARKCGPHRWLTAGITPRSPRPFSVHSAIQAFPAATPIPSPFPTTTIPAQMILSALCLPPRLLALADFTFVARSQQHRPQELRSIDTSGDPSGSLSACRCSTRWTAQDRDSSPARS